MLFSIIAKNKKKETSEKVMDEYNDKHGALIKEGLYVSETGTYFRIRNTSQTEWIVTSSLNPKLSNSLTSDLASKLTPLLAGRMKVKELRETADWLEGQLEEISVSNE